MSTLRISLMLLVTIVSGAIASELPPLEQRIKAFKVELAKEKSLKDKVASLRAFEEWVAEEAQKRLKGEASIPSGEDFSILAFNECLSSISAAEFDPKQCDAYREMIIASFSPQNPHPKASQIIPEGREALNILALVCGK